MSRSAAGVALALALVVSLLPQPAGARTATPIMGPPLLSAEELTDWFEASGRTPDLPVPVSELAAMFVEEGLLEGVRGDVAFAQAVFETDYFIFTGSVPPEANNYGGIGAPNDVQAFPDPRTGVRAMIQHLRAYADPTADRTGTATPLVDPRWDLVRPKGKATTFEELSRLYAVGDRYGPRVVRLYRRIVEHAARPLAPEAPIVGMAGDPGGGVVLADRDGGVYAVGGATYSGSAHRFVSTDVVAVDGSPLGDGYLLADRNGGVYAFGTAGFHGSVTRLVADGLAPRRTEVADIALTPSGNGYLVLARDGSVYPFGDARSFGSLRIPGDAGAVAIALTPLGDGYVVLTADGGVFAFGAAQFHGSVQGSVFGGTPPEGFAARDVAATPDGYFVVDARGGVYAFGDARYRGNRGDERLSGEVVGIEPIAPTNGYRLVTSDGGSFAYG